MSRDGTPWTVLVGRGRLYGLAGELFRDGFVPHETPQWPVWWREALETAAARERLAATSGTVLRAFDEARDRRQETIRERSELLLLGGCPAYETAYADAFGRQRDLADIAAFYRAFGLRADGDRPDHLAVECEFAALLCLKESIARASRQVEEADRCRDARRAFLRDHLGTWLGLYAEDLASRSHLPLLGAGVAVLRAILALDAEDLGIELHDRPRPARDLLPQAPSCDPPAAQGA